MTINSATTTPFSSLTRHGDGTNHHNQCSFLIKKKTGKKSDSFPMTHTVSYRIKDSCLYDTMPNHQDNYELYQAIILQISWNISLMTIIHEIMHSVAIFFQLHPSEAFLLGWDSRWKKKMSGEKKAEFFYETQKWRKKINIFLIISKVCRQ